MRILLIAGIIICGSSTIYGQQDNQIPPSGIIEEPDTSDYIPEFYTNGINYNLMIAASKGYVSEIDRLIARGADVKFESGEGATPLVFAVGNNQLEAVKSLLGHNAPPDKVTTNSETPLIIAVKNNNTDIAEALIRTGADIDLPDRYGATPLHWAATLGNFDMADMLLYYNAAIDQKSDEGASPLLASIMAGSSNITGLLIQSGANLEARNKEGFTPFLMAGAAGDTLAMELLSRYSIDIYAVNNAGYTALDLAIASNHPEAVKYLLKKGDKWTGKPDNAVNPYKVAAKYERRDITAILKANNLPGEITFGIDQFALSLSSRFTSRDYFSGISLAFKEPYLNGGLLIGIDMKLWYTRVLVKEDEHLFYQYWSKSNLIYAGLYKDFRIYEKPYKSELSISAALLGGYSFGSTLRGSSDEPSNKFRFIPTLSVKYQHRNIGLMTGLEYINSEYYRNGPVWFRAGVSYTMFFDRVRTDVKWLKWH